jgi:hypothetical protein
MVNPFRVVCLNPEDEVIACANNLVGLRAAYETAALSEGYDPVSRRARIVAEKRTEGVIVTDKPRVLRLRRAAGPRLRAPSRQNAQLPWFVERCFQQASRITLTKFCRGDDSCSDALPHHFRLASTLKLCESGFESFAHRRNCLGVEPSRFHK